MIKRLLLAVFSLCLSAGLILSIPVLNFIIHGRSGEKDQKNPVTVTLKKASAPKQMKQIKKQLRRPEQRRPTRTQLKAGPRFAMDLGLAGGTGAGITMELMKKGEGGTSGSGDVDERPVLDGQISLNLPAEIRKQEIDAYCLMSFCVDGAGRVYEIQVVEERPPGMGLAEAGKSALSTAGFRPAQKDGLPVSFCGMEIPFEVKFDD